MKGKKSTSGPSFEHGMFEADLVEINCYTSENFNSKDPEVNLTFVWNMGPNPDDESKDLMYYDSFVTLYQDEDGYPVIGGKKGKMYKRLYGLYGREFDPFADDLDWEIVFPAKYDDPDKLLNLPHWQSYNRDDPRLEIKSLKVAGQELIGRTAQIELGNAQKPDGTFSTKTSVIDCKPIARRRPRKVEAEAEDTEPLPI